NADRYAPHSSEGRRLLSHELAHVVQQRRGGATPALDATAPHERAADSAAEAAMTSAGPIAVGSATATGVAREEDDDSFTARFQRKVRAVRDKIPQEYREPLSKAADYVADKTVDVALTPLVGPIGGGDIGSTFLHAATSAATGEGDPVEDVKAAARTKVQEGIGTAKGVVTQVTEVADIALWLGNEYKGARDKAAKAVGGKEGTAGNFAVKKGIDLIANVTGMSALPAAAEAGDQLAALGLVDEYGTPNITAPLTEKANEAVKWTEEAIGGTPSDPELFTPAEKAELKASIGVQVALAFTGAEEVKIAMNVIGVLGGLRGVVESVRHDPNWKTSSRFWGSIIGMVLSVVGLKHTMAASKITTLVLKFGWVAAAIPPMAQMVADYLNTDLTEEERERRMKQNWIQVVHVLKDAILHVAQSQGGKSAAPNETPTTTTGKGGTGGGDVDVNTPPTNKTVQPAAKTGATETTTPNQVAQPAVKADTQNQPLPQVTEGGVTPIKRSTPPPTSKASKKLQSDLDKLPPEKAGTVTPLRPKKGGKPPSEPAQQKIPVAQEEQQKIAVGQTHDAGGGKQGPALTVVPSDAPMASAGGGKGGKGGTPTDVSAPVVGKGGTAAGGKSAAGKVGSAQTGKKAPVQDEATVAPTKKTTPSDQIEARLGALKVPKGQRKAFNKAANLVRKRAVTDPASAEELLQGLERRFGAPAPASKGAQVAEDVAEAQSKLYPEKTASGKHTQSRAADERALQDQQRPGAKVAKKAKVKESERMGVAGGEAQAAKEGIAVKDWDTPQKWKGEFGQGPDALGSRGDKELILEFKGGGSALSKSKRTGVVEMSNEWVGRKIAELEFVGDKATAARLLKAAREGKLQGVVYRTRQLKAGEKTSRLKSHQLRDHLTDENIRESGLIEYSPTKVEQAYQQRLQELQQSEASGDVKSLP
ncbi:MAG: DUF4157 domain-containing protein, partial [Sulfurifustaceae bacterium]